VLGHGLKALRVLAGLTQAGLAELAGPDMTVSRLKSLEMGKVRRLTHADTASLAEALGTTKEAIRAGKCHPDSAWTAIIARDPACSSVRLECRSTAKVDRSRMLT
jgi:transcriptional regulator with XRE-family HTH domain